MEALTLVNFVLLSMSSLLFVGSMNKYTDAARKLEETRRLALRVLLKNKRS